MYINSCMKERRAAAEGGKGDNEAEVSGAERRWEHLQAALTALQHAVRLRCWMSFTEGWPTLMCWVLLRWPLDVGRHAAQGWRLETS